jgi:valyl-tRNA synthetase
MDKRYEHHHHEALMRDLWEREKIYKAENGSGPLFSIDTPPPTVSGTLHIGHIFSYTHTDIIARFQRMNGRTVFYPFGFDDNGLPTERYVERKRGISSNRMSRSDFISACLEETVTIEERFKNLWQRMGLSVDWDACYATIDSNSRKISQESFIRLHEQGYAYRRHEPALYCTTCHTSVAQAELDDMNIQSHFNTIIFTTDDGTHLYIGTTRPELLPSCVALLYNPHDVRYQYLAHTTIKTPLFGHTVPIIADESVSIEKGTGLVMCCTFGDKMDVEWFKKFNLPYRQSVNLNGKWSEHTGILQGLKCTEARQRVLEELEKAGLLVKQEPISHSVNVHERCKKEIEYVVLSQWFIRIIDFKQTFIELAEKITWHPAFMKSRYINWVENLTWDWCISRQRFFGIPFPVWHCLDCAHVIVAQIDQLPIDPQETPYTNSCTACGSTNIKPDCDVMDTWNTSSLTPMLVYSLYNKNTPSPFTDEQIKNFIPMSMRPQAHDIIRTWAFDTIVKTWMHFKTIPWESIVISGHVLTSDKEKISKSRDNNPMDPDRLLTSHAADVIRFWTASGNLGHDTAFSETQLAIGQKLCTKLWNAFRFTADHLNNFIATPTTPTHLGVINEWLLHNASKTFEHYHAYFDRSEFGLALSLVDRFFWNDFCDNYLELVKHQLFNAAHYDQDVVYATQWTLYTVGLRILQLYAPYLPYITDSIYQERYRSQIHTHSIHQTTFENIQKSYIFNDSVHHAMCILDLVAQARKLKTTHQVSLKTEIADLLVIAHSQELLDTIQSAEQLVKGVTQARTIRYKYSQVHDITTHMVNNHMETIIDNNETTPAPHWHATIVIGQETIKQEIL